MVGYLKNPKNVARGDRVRFMYNRRERAGTVDTVGRAYVTIKHDSPTSFEDREYSSYRFDRLGSKISLV